MCMYICMYVRITLNVCMCMCVSGGVGSLINNFRTAAAVSVYCLRCSTAARSLTRATCTVLRVCLACPESQKGNFSRTRVGCFPIHFTSSFIQPLNPFVCIPFTLHFIYRKSRTQCILNEVFISDKQKRLFLEQKTHVPNYKGSSYLSYHGLK